jgi:hypothetical protein
MSVGLSFNSVKPLDLEEEKEQSLGREPVIEFLPSARFKSVVNMVRDTGFSQA